MSGCWRRPILTRLPLRGISRQHRRSGRGAAIVTDGHEGEFGKHPFSVVGELQRSRRVRIQRRNAGIESIAVGDDCFEILDADGDV